MHWICSPVIGRFSISSNSIFISTLASTSSSKRSITLISDSVGNPCANWEYQTKSLLIMTCTKYTDPLTITHTEITKYNAEKFFIFFWKSIWYSFKWIWYISSFLLIFCLSKLHSKFKSKFFARLLLLTFYYAQFYYIWWERNFFLKIEHTNAHTKMGHIKHYLHPLSVMITINNIKHQFN